jgi:hypothetical protein
MGMVVLAEALRYKGVSAGFEAVVVDSVEMFSINLGLEFPVLVFVPSNDKLSGARAAGRKTLQASRLKSKANKMN